MDTISLRNKLKIWLVLFLFLPIYAQASSFSKSIAVAGYSIANYQSVNATVLGPNARPAMIYSNRSALAWASRFLRGEIFFNLNSGYQDANWNGVRKFVIGNGGSGYTTAPTITLSGPGCAITPVAGTPTIGGGQLLSIPVTTAGAACNGGLTVTISGGGGTGALAYAVLGGTGNLGVPGETTAGTAARLGDITSSSASLIVFDDGGNDRNNGLTTSQTETNLQSIYTSLTSAGKIVIDHIEGPINVSGGLFTSNQYRQILQTNAWRKQYIRDQQSDAILTLDTTAEETDGGSASGASLANMRDSFGVHPLTSAAIIDGWKLAQMLKRALGIWEASGSATNQNDIYDATNNPLGFMNADPFMTATGGTNTSSCTGSTANGWTFERTAGSATGSCSVAVSTRTDLYSGKQEIFTASLGSGTTSEVYSFYTENTPANYGIVAGDLVYGVCDVEASNTKNLNWLELDVVPFTSGFATVFDLADGDNGASNDHYPDAGSLGSLSSATPLTFRTMPYTMPSGGTFTSIADMRLVFHIGFDASGGANSAAGTFKISNCGIRKYQ